MEWEKQETMRLLQGRPGTVYQEGDAAAKQAYRDWLKRMLHVGVTTVTFTKADGSVRDMKATLDPAYVPTSAYPTAVPASLLTEDAKKPAPENIEVCKVWDTEANAWRSFRYDRIKSISINLG
jgi:hypothetical protein